MPKGVYYKRSEEGEKRRLASIPKGKNHWNYDDNPSVSAIHRWLNRKYGKANHCANITCKNKSKCYDWALLKGKDYKRLRGCFMQLCRSCHIEYDMTEERKKKISENLKIIWKKNL